MALWADVTQHLRKLDLTVRVLELADAEETEDLITETFLTYEGLCTQMRLDKTHFKKGFMMPVLNALLPQGLTVGIEDKNHKLVGALLCEELPPPGQHSGEVCTHQREEAYNTAFRVCLCPKSSQD